MVHTTLTVLLTTVLFAHVDFRPQAGKRYVLNAPEGYVTWFLAKSPSDAHWCVMASKADVLKLCGVNDEPSYDAGVMATVERVQGEAVLVAVQASGTGWVMRETLDLTAEDRAVLVKKRAQEKAATDKKRANEQAYVASLPTLWNGVSGPIFVATSFDCAKDFRNVIEFGRKNGTGIEYRKRMLELLTLGCTTKIDAGTAINVISQKDGFVQFRAYNGDQQGTVGIALVEHVRFR